MPALLIYKNGELIGNFVGLADEFGTEFDENDVEDFFVELVSLNSFSKFSNVIFHYLNSKQKQYIDFKSIDFKHLSEFKSIQNTSKMIGQ